MYDLLFPPPSRANFERFGNGLVPMTRDERLEFVNWRNPQYDGAFSCINETGRHLTWIPGHGIFMADSNFVRHILSGAFGWSPKEFEGVAAHE